MGRLKYLIFAACAAILLLTVGGGLALTRPAAAQGVTPPQGERVDRQVLETLAASGSADFVIEMAEQADLSAAYAISDWNERGQYVVDTLKATAERSQKDAIGQLNRQGARFTSYFVSNVIVVRGGNQRALDAVQNLPGVARVRAPVVVRLEPVEEVLRRAVEIKLPQAVLAGTPTWGLTDTGATKFQAIDQKDGQGIIVANIDSGVQYNHPALAGAYRCAGGNPADPKCWLNLVPSDTCPVGTPCDDNGHGTHTMGTMVGTNLLYNSAPYTIGMAPAANWIACKAFDLNGNAYNTDIIACAQWLLAPGGSAANRPHIINNSWGGDTTASDSWFRSYVQAWRAAGMFPVFSAGNKGSGCTTLGSPADYPEGFAVAAHDQYGAIAYFSSRGPITFGEMPYTKPNLSAPGVNVVSAYKDSASKSLPGTSMAAPHVSGAVALLWSCNPGLVGQIDQTFQLLQNSAGTPPAGSCGAPASGGGNYTYGYGYLNVFQAGVGTCVDWPKIYLPLISNNNNYVPPDPVQNGGFESGDVAWNEVYTGNVGLILNTSFGLPIPPHGGSWLTWLGGVYDEVSSISQSVTIPVGRSVLHYWFASGSTDTCGYDYFKIFVGSTAVFTETLCVSNETNAWVHRTVDLSAYAGTTQAIMFRAETNSANNSNVFLDDISFETSTALSGSAVNGSSNPLPVDGSAAERLKTRKQD